MFFLKVFVCVHVRLCMTLTSTIQEKKVAHLFQQYGLHTMNYDYVFVYEQSTLVAYMQSVCCSVPYTPVHSHIV